MAADRTRQRFATLCYRLQDARLAHARLVAQTQVVRQRCRLPIWTVEIPPFPLYTFTRSGGGLRMVRRPSIAGGADGWVGDSRPGDFPSNSFRCTQRHLDGAICLVLSGELDLATAETFRAHLRVAVQGTGGIMLDLRDLRYLDSSGLNALLDTHRDASPSGRRIALVKPSPVVRRILSVLRLENLMPVFSSVEEALIYLRSGSDSEQQRPSAGS